MRPIRCLMHELNDFWQFSPSDFSTNFQDFQRALRLQQHECPAERGQEPVPVPSPAAQERDFSQHDNSFLCGGEGWRSSRAAWSLRQPQSKNNQQTNHVNPGRDQFKTVKRAYRRACKRANAAAAGGTWYKGQWMTARALRSQYVTDIPRQAPLRREGRQRSAGYKHYNFMSWNAGGLATNTWDALQNWLAEHSVDICCIQETHWPMTQEWCNSNYHIFHHGQGRAGGLMTLVRTTVAAKNHIRSGSLANGRIQHTRILHQHGGIDIVNVYQKVWSHGDVSSLMSQRLTVWTALTKCLDGLPARNQVIVAGDMNTQLTQHTKVTGPAVPKRAYRDSRDEHELLDIMRVKNMVAINTFRVADPYTFVGPSSKTQIDYIIMRNTQAVGHSKEAHGLHEFPLLVARGEGYHVPLWARLPSRWRVWRYGPSTSSMRGPSKDEMASYVQQHSAFVSSQIADAIGHGSGCEAPATLEDLDGVMMQVQSQLQSIVPNSSMLKPKPWQDETLRGTLSTAWRHLHQARAEKGKGLRSLFSAWRHACQFLRLIASTRKHCRRLRRARLLSFLEDAQEQANKHNIHGVFKVVNKLAPRNLQRPQIRHADGTLMDAEQESQATAAYLQEVYQDSSKSSFPTDLQADGIPFTCEELQGSMSAIPARKAGPRHLACNVFYKHSAACVAPVLYGFLQRWWAGGIPYVPQPFKDAWLTMLPKPGRVCKSPSDLRPIGLSHPLGKSILRVLRSKILPYARTFMDNVPQWGFMPNREVSDALSRAFQHCASVRKQCKTQTPSLNRRWEGVQSRALVGGLAIALDISKAFDTIPHAEIFNAMADAQVPDNLRALVMMWLDGAQYHVQGADGALAVNVRRGVRQGCVLSPLLYVLVVARIHRKLQDTMGAEADQTLDYYADDTLFHAEFDTLQGFRLALAKAEKLLEHLDTAGLDINDTKTQVLLRLSGKQAKQIRREVTEVRHGQPHLRLHALWTQRFLPIVDKAKYLGTQISYDTFEDQTVLHRITAARAAFGRLRRVLTSRSNLTVSKRIHLWSTCVGTCLYYGLDACGLTLSGLQKIRVLVQKQLRAISRQPAHITHLSNQELLDELGVAVPGAYIHQRARSLLQRWERNENSTERIAIKAQAFIGIWRRAVLSGLEQMLRNEQVAGRSLLTCPHCGKECATPTVLGSHISQAHAPQHRPTFDRAKHSTGGRSRCSGCKVLYSSWARLCKHIEHGACPFPVESVAKTATDSLDGDEKEGEHAHTPELDREASDVPLCKQQPVQELVRQQGWRALIQHQSLRPKLAQWCCICGTWCASNRAVKMHLARSHKEIWMKHRDRVERLCKSQLAMITVPCQLCGSVSKEPKAHVIACPVLFQSIFLHLLADNGGICGSELLSAPSTGGEQPTGSGLGQQAIQDGGQPTGQRQTARQGALSHWIREAGGSAAVGGDSKAGAQAGRRTSDPFPGLRLHVVCGDGAGRSPTHHVWGERRMEEAQRTDAAPPEKATTCDYDGVHPEGASGPAGEGHTGRSSQEHGNPSGLDDRSWTVEVQGLGLNQESLGRHGRHATDHAGPGLRPENYDCHSPGARSSKQVSGIAANASRHGNHLGTQGSLLHHPGGAEGRQGGAASSVLDQAWGQYGPQTVTQSTAARTGPETRHGEACLRPAPATVMRLVLHNSGDLCYMNAMVHAILWLMAHSNIQVQDMGQGYNTWRAIAAQRKACNLMQMLPWNRIVQGWQHGGSQHDIRDFFEHVFSRCQVSPFHGAWEARFQDQDVCRRHDRGLCENMITMDVPLAGPWSLQDVVNGWGNHAFLHGLLLAPQWLAVRLNRFHYADGRLQKVRSETEHAIQGPISPSSMINFVGAWSLT